jgi:hypothetical protein
MKKSIFIILLFSASLILTAAAFIYFVSGVSSVSRPIKQYECAGNIDQLISGIQKYTTQHPDVGFRITDTTGRPDDVAIYMTIEIKTGTSDVEYRWECEQKTNGENTKTIIGLIEAYDKTHNTGGYIKDAKGVKKLVDFFDSSFVPVLKKQQSIELRPI